MLIGLHGDPAAGKDHTARLLAEYGYERRAFADKVRECLLALNPVVLVEGGRGVRLRPLLVAHGWDKLKRCVPEVRDLLDRMGTDVGRNVLAERIWIDLLFADMLVDTRYVITDVRNENEVHAVKSRGGVIVHVTRPGTEAPSDHPIHRRLDPRHIDYVLHNDSGPEALAERVSHLAWWAEHRDA